MKGWGWMGVAVVAVVAAAAGEDDARRAAAAAAALTATMRPRDGATVRDGDQWHSLLSVLEVEEDAGALLMEGAVDAGPAADGGATGASGGPGATGSGVCRCVCLTRACVCPTHPAPAAAAVFVNPVVGGRAGRSGASGRVGKCRVVPTVYHPTP